MCVVSMIGDHFNEKWRQPYQDGAFNNITRLEFELLRQDVLEMKELLKKALEYDKKNNEPDCHIDEKINFLKKFAELFEIDLAEIFVKKLDNNK